MKFITDYDGFHSEIGGHDVYKVVEFEGATHAAVLATFIGEELRPNDMDSGFDEKFQVRFDDDTCFEVNYSAWIEHDPDWRIRDYHEAREIALEDCKIKEAPGAFITQKIRIEDTQNIVAPDNGVILGAYVSSRPREVGKGLYSLRNSTGCLALIETASGEMGVRMHINALTDTITIPVSVLKDNGCQIEVLIKAPIDESPEDSPAP